MFNVTHSERSPTMTTTKDKPAAAAIKDLLSQSPDGLREIVRAVMQEMLEAEMTDALGAEKGERTPARPDPSPRGGFWLSATPTSLERWTPRAAGAAHRRRGALPSPARDPRCRDGRRPARR